MRYDSTNKMELRNVFLALTTPTFVKLKGVVGKRNLKHVGFVLLLCHEVLYLKHRHFSTARSTTLSTVREGARQMASRNAEMSQGKNMTFN
jgi:hypothetical protein